MPDEELKNAIRECNRSGVRVKGFFTTLNFSELASIALRITKENESRIFNILKSLEQNNYVKVIFSYVEREHIETVRVFANIRNKAKIFNIIRNSVKKKSDFNTLSLPLQEIYKMHKSLTKEDIDHQIIHYSGKFFQSTIIKNIDSYFTYGAERVKKIYGSTLWESTDAMNDQNYNYIFKNKTSMLNKMRKINYELDKEFKWQADKFEALCEKYRRDPNDENSDMFTRLAKVRDEYEL